MKPKDIEKQIIEKYQNDERMMVLIFCQWCINHDLVPEELYQKAYPNQPTNELIQEMKEQTVAKQEAEHISNETLLEVLQLFGD